MDEYVTEGLLGYSLEGDEAMALESLMRSISTTAQNAIYKEQVEAQSIMAFHIFARTTKVLYRLGVAIGLKVMGYSYAKIQIPQVGN